MMNQSAPNLFAGRYVLPEGDHSGTISVVDTMPWQRCWACGSLANEAGDAFCNDCGAALDERSYRAILTTPDALIGPALVPTIDAEEVRLLLPEVVAQVTEDDRVLTLLHDHGPTTLAAPLDELAALDLGMTFARLLVYLHDHAMVLGSLSMTDLEVMPSGRVRLRDAVGLRRVEADQASAMVRADLMSLAELLEQLTVTPRTTRRLSEEAAAAAEAEQPGLPLLLRQVRTGECTNALTLLTRLEAMRAERAMPVCLRQIVGAATHVGMVRDHNEDSYLCLQLAANNNSSFQAVGLYLVSDGMGGHAAGELASGLAMRAAAQLVMQAYLAQALDPEHGYNQVEIGELVRRAVLAANEAVVNEARAQGNDMGATLTMALVIGDRVTVGNVGDSRTYRYHEGRLIRISKDHSLVQRLVDLGQIADQDIYTHPQRNAVLRSLGDRREVEVDIFHERVRAGDALLLCSDGQWEMTHDPEMELLLAADDDPHVICERLIAAANRAGGEDNIASILVRFADTPGGI
ncbi:MAG: serine/threonine-protein phosphatase [Chloroflexia bacterium]|nr:serine/threonine-protein phosphatase [Chloroflexia bacterium]